MNTQQFFKGLMMALITVLVTFFTSTPIDFMLLAVTAVCTILTYFGKNLIPWLHSDSPPASLSLINIGSGVLIALGAALTESVATYLVEGQILWPIAWKVAAYTTGTYLVSTFFAPPYSTEKKRFVATKGYISRYRKMAVLIGVLAILPVMASAQKISIFAPVPDNLFAREQTADKNFITESKFLPRFTFGVNGNLLLYNKVLKQFEQQDYARAGAGLSMAHYKPGVDGTPFNDWSLNFLVLKPLAGDASISYAVTVSAFTFFQAGIDFCPALIKTDYFPVGPTFGLKYTF